LEIFGVVGIVYTDIAGTACRQVRTSRHAIVEGVKIPVIASAASRAWMISKSHADTEPLGSDHRKRSIQGYGLKEAIQIAGDNRWLNESYRLDVKDGRVVKGQLCQPSRRGDPVENAKFYDDRALTNRFSRMPRH
jgi:hypothetical protein